MVFIPSSSVSFLKPDVIPYKDGRILFQCILPRGCSGPTDFKVHIVPGDDDTAATKLQVLKKVPKWKRCARTRLHGLIPGNSGQDAAAQNIHWSNLQSDINKRLRALGKMHQDDIWEIIDEAALPFPVELHKVDAYGKPTTSYYIGNDDEGYEWVTLWLSGIHRRQQIQGTSCPVGAVRVGQATTFQATQQAAPQRGTTQNMSFGAANLHANQQATPLNGIPHTPQLWTANLQATQQATPQHGIPSTPQLWAANLQAAQQATPQHGTSSAPLFRTSGRRNQRRRRPSATFQRRSQRQQPVAHPRVSLKPAPAPPNFLLPPLAAPPVLFPPAPAATQHPAQQAKQPPQTVQRAAPTPTLSPMDVDANLQPPQQQDTPVENGANAPTLGADDDDEQWTWETFEDDDDNDDDDEEIGVPSTIHMSPHPPNRKAPTRASASAPTEKPQPTTASPPAASRGTKRDVAWSIASSVARRPRKIKRKGVATGSDDRASAPVSDGGSSGPSI